MLRYFLFAKIREYLLPKKRIHILVLLFLNAELKIHLKLMNLLFIIVLHIELLWDPHFSLRELSKHRLAVLICCNADGTERMLPLVVGRYDRPK